MLLTLTSCTLFQSETDSVSDLLPRDTDVPGWVRTDSFSSYRGKDVKNYNRDYADIGIEKMAFCVYKLLDNPETEIKLEVIKFDSVLDAYGFYSIKRGPGIFDISVVNEYYTNTFSVIQIGEYVLYSQTEKTESLLKNDLKTLVNIPVLYIGKNYIQDRLPAKLNILRNTDGYGVLYSIKAYYKLPLLNNICFTQWLRNKEIIDVFLTDCDSFYNAYKIFKKCTENNYIIISSDNIHTAFKKEPDGRYSFISINDKWIFGCWSVSNFNEGKRILNEIQSKIEDYKQISHD